MPLPNSLPPLRETPSASSTCTAIPASAAHHRLPGFAASPPAYQQALHQLQPCTTVSRDVVGSRMGQMRVESKARAAAGVAVPAEAPSGAGAPSAHNL